MSEDHAWFGAKRYGYGAGLPISWQGWAVTIAYVAIVVLLALAFCDRPLVMILAIIAPTLAFMVIAARTTRGGWRWRWGEDE